MLKVGHVKGLILVGIVTCVVTIALFYSGDYLIVNSPERSDVILVMGGDHNDLRYWRGLALLREGYGQRVVVDATTDRVYGRTYAEHAAAFVAQTAGDHASRISICPITNDSTVQETSNVESCLSRINSAPKSVLIVTNDFHTRRARSILSSRLPQYRWSVAAVNDTTLFGKPWWRHREWAKTCVYEWEKLLWWKCFEAWRR